MDELIDRIARFRGELEEARDKSGADLMDEAIQALRELQSLREENERLREELSGFRNVRPRDERW